jgi:hypothetical protein
VEVGADQRFVGAVAGVIVGGSGATISFAVPGFRDLQMPHVPPSFEQCLQYLQFLHALQGVFPRHVAAFTAGAAPSNSNDMTDAARRRFI